MKNCHLQYLKCTNVTEITGPTSTLFLNVRKETACPGKEKKKRGEKGWVGDGDGDRIRRKVGVYVGKRKFSLNQNKK